jgi:spore cortex protein
MQSYSQRVCFDTEMGILGVKMKEVISMKKLIFPLVSVFALLLAGCTLNDDELGQEGEDGGMGVQQVRYNTTNTGENNIYGEANPADPTYGMTDKMANKVMKLYEVERAYVFTKGEDAYAAIVLENRLDSEVDDELQRKIKESVISVNNNIQNVYVTTDRELVNELKTYRKQIHNGEAVRDLGDRIGERVSRLFPNVQ